MKNNRINFILFTCSLILLAVTFLPNMATPLWADNEKPVPMDLNGTEWNVEMIFVTEKGKKNTSGDKLIFADKKFISEEFEDKGYEPSNYSLTLEEDGKTKFGTMQIMGKETSFWKGKVIDNKIDGSVHTQLSSGSTRTTYFTGTLESGKLKPKVKDKPKFPKPDPVRQPTKVTPPAPEQPPVAAPVEVKEEMPAEVVEPVEAVEDADVPEKAEE